MKKTKITAWILFATMIMTLFPSSFVFADEISDMQAKCPELAITFITQDSGTVEGDDLGDAGTYIPTDGENLNGEFDETVRLGDEPNSVFVADKAMNTNPATRRQLVTITATSMGGQFGLNHALNNDAVQFTFLDLDKKPLKENTDGTMASATDYEWIDYNSLTGVDKDINEFNTSTEKYKRVSATKQQAANDHKVAVTIWNILKTEFNGYIRIKVTDDNGYSTYQDILVIADGLYPEIEVKSSTTKYKIGEENTHEVDTKIEGRVFRNGNDGLKSEVKAKVNPWYIEASDTLITDEDMRTEITDMLKRYDYWASNDITVDITATDKDMSSELESLEWKVYNVKNPLVALAEENTLNPTYQDKIIAPDYVNGVYNSDNMKIHEQIVIPTTDENGNRINEGENILVVTATDKAGLTTTRYYYFFVDYTNPKGSVSLVEDDTENLLDKVVSLFSNSAPVPGDAGTVDRTKRGIDMSSSKDVEQLYIYSGLIDGDTEIPTYAKYVAYQYRLIDIDGDPDLDADWGFTQENGIYVAPAGATLNYGEWQTWDGDPDTMVIKEEFDGLVQVRVQDRAGNWSVLSADDIMEAQGINPEAYKGMIGDVTNPLVSAIAYTADDETKTNILDDANVAAWTNEDTILEVRATDYDLTNGIRSSGLDEGEIWVKVISTVPNFECMDVECGDLTHTLGAPCSGASATQHSHEHSAFSDTVEVLGQADGVAPMEIATGEAKQITSDYIFADENGVNNTDKESLFQIRYKGTGTIAVEVYIVDKAGNVKPYTRVGELRVDRINPVITEVKLTETTDDVEDVEEWSVADWFVSLFAVDEKDPAADYTTRKQLEVSFDTYDTALTNPVAGSLDEPVIDCEYRHEHCNGPVGYCTNATDDHECIGSTCADWVWVTSTHTNCNYYYQSGIKVDDGTLGIRSSIYTDDKYAPILGSRIEKVEYILIPEEIGAVNGSGAQITPLAGATNDEVLDYIKTNLTAAYKNEGTDMSDEEIAAEVDRVLAEEWKECTAADRMQLVVDKEFQGSIVLRMWDNAGNIDYSKPITIVAESKSPIIKLQPAVETVEGLKDYDTLNNYGWSKREYNYLEIRVKDQNEADVDAWIKSVKINTKTPTAQYSTTFDKYDSYAWNDITTDYEIFTDDLEAEANTRDEEGYMSLGYIRVKEITPIVITITDKAGNVTEATYNVSIERKAPMVNFDLIKVYEGEEGDADVSDNYNNALTLDIFSEDIPAGENEPASGLAPQLTDESYNKFVGTTTYGEKLYEIKGIDENVGADAEDYKENLISYFYTSDEILDYDTIPSQQEERSGYVKEAYDEETDSYVPTRYEIPGLQYALIPMDGNVHDVKAWDFYTDPTTIYTNPETGYYNDEFGKTYVWHNYVDKTVPVVPENFNGYVVVRATDKAGNIRLMGSSAHVSVVAERDTWIQNNTWLKVSVSERHNYGMEFSEITDAYYAGNNYLMTLAKDAFIEPDNKLYEPSRLEKVDILRDAYNKSGRDGAEIKIGEEGITAVIVGATEEFNEPVWEYSAVDEDGDPELEGYMVIGNIVGIDGEMFWVDYKYQITPVMIDKTNPEFAFELIDEESNVIKDNAVKGTVSIKLTDIIDPIPNTEAPNPTEPDRKLAYFSHIPSDIAKVEWCAVPEGSEEEIWQDATDLENNLVGTFDADAFTGTIKVRVTDNAGNVTEKSQRLNVDAVPALISLSLSNDDVWSKDPVDVTVTVSENAEFSDVAEVTYVVTDENGDVVVNASGANEEGILPNTGGVVSVDREGISTVTVIAKTKAGVTEQAEAIVKIDRSIPDFKLRVTDLEGATLIGPTTGGIKVYADAVVDYPEAPVKNSEVAKVEYAIITEGAADETWTEMPYVLGEYTMTYLDADAFTGTVKVRVTDNAGNVIVKAQKFEIDNVKPLINLTKSYNTEYATENATVTATVTKNAAFSDVTKVTYKTTGAQESEGTLTLDGGAIEITAEGETTVTVTAENKAGETETATTTVRIDKTAPTFDLAVVDSNGSVEDRVTNEDVTIKAENVNDATSGVAKVEYAVIPEGTAEENYTEIEAVDGKYEVTYSVDEAFTGTIKVRVTDNAGYETVKSMKIDIDKAMPIINLSKSYETTCNNGPVDVFVTVSETAEFSDVASVVYTVDGENEKELPLIGGTISINKEGTSVVKVTATNKAGVSVSEETTVIIHHNKLAMPVIEGAQPGSWKTSENTVTVTYAGSEPVYYSINGSDWKVLPANKKIELEKGANKIMLQARSNTCQCVSDINTYEINYDEGTPIVELEYDSEWTKETATVQVIVNRGACESDVKSVTYDLAKKGGTTEKGKHLANDGGNIVIDEEGEWTVSNITVEMVSGIKYVHAEKAVVKVDKTAPELGFELEDTTDFAELLGMADVNSRYQQKLAATVNDALSGVAGKLEYAVMEKGVISPTWVEFDKNDKPTVITTAFDGTVLVKATDNAGNSVTVSKTVFTEGIKPEISITGATEWINKDARLFVNIIDKALSSAINEVKVDYYYGATVDEAKKMSDADVAEYMVEALTAEGGTIDVKREGKTTVVVTATDAAGNTAEQIFVVNIDKSAPTYTGFNNGWVYNTDVWMKDVTDDVIINEEVKERSGIESVKIVFTSETGLVTTRENIQTNYEFTADGTYEITLTDKAGNSTTVSFVIDKDLEFVINVWEVDDTGRVLVAVDDYETVTENYTFYEKFNENRTFTEEHTGTFDWIDKTGVYQIYATDKKGNRSNTLTVLIAPTKNVNTENVMNEPLRDVDLIIPEDENVTITKTTEIFNENMNELIYSGTGANKPNVALFEDGVYVIVEN